MAICTTCEQIFNINWQVQPMSPVLTSYFPKVTTTGYRFQAVRGRQGTCLATHPILCIDLAFSANSIIYKHHRQPLVTITLQITTENAHPSITTVEPSLLLVQPSTKHFSDPLTSSCWFLKRFSRSYFSLSRRTMSEWSSCAFDLSLAPSAPSMSSAGMRCLRMACFSASSCSFDFLGAPEVESSVTTGCQTGDERT